MEHCFDTIMALPNSYGIKNVVRRWQRLSERMTGAPAAKPVILSDLLLIAKYGVGKTYVLQLLSEYLVSRGNLMDFYGDVRFFEFYVNYCRPGEPFHEIGRLMSSAASAAGFRSEYRGIVCLDINEWTGHFEEKHFIDLLEYLSVNSDYWLIIFTVSEADREKLKNLEAVISMFLRIETAELRLPPTEELLGYIRKRLKEYGLSMSRDAEELLCGTINTLSGNKYFDGYKTLDLLVRDMIYHLYSSKKSCGEVLTTVDLEMFSESSEYVQRRLLHYETKKRLIGFA